MREFKSLALKDFKVLDRAEGIVEAYVNSMGVVDSDGDVIAPEAFNNSIKNNLPIPVLSGHDQNQIVGKVIKAKPEEDEEERYKLKATMQLNMDTQAGREAYSNISGQYVREWSVGFNLNEGGVESERINGKVTRVINDLDWVEVSAVVRGASPNTTTISAKTDKKAIPFKSTPTTDEAWNGPEARTRIANDAGADVLREAYAWVAEGANPDAKSSYKFIHHEVSESGKVGSANLRACSSAIAVLNGGRGGTTIPKTDRKAVYNHLAGHLKDADRDVPELLTDSRVRVHRRSDDWDQMWELDDDMANSILPYKVKEDNPDVMQYLDNLTDEDLVNFVQALFAERGIIVSDEKDTEVGLTAEDDDLKVDADAENDTATSDETVELTAITDEMIATAERQLELLNLMLENQTNSSGDTHEHESS